jgi:hypothetical protein
LNLSHLVFAVALDRRFAAFLNQPFALSVKHPRLLDFKTPDLMVWPFLFSILGSFLKGLPETFTVISFNTMIIMGSFYFFQGLAVLENILYTIRAGLFPRILVYVLLVGQMFLFLVSVGLLDYWIDIRTQFLKWLKKPKT